jgi:hypothetical protein
MSVRSEILTTIAHQLVSAHTRRVAGRRISSLMLGVFLSATGCAGSGSPPPPPSRTVQADCVARIQFHGVVYGPARPLRGSARSEQAIGSGIMVGCDGQRIGPHVRRNRVTIYAVNDVPTSTAIATDRQHGHYAYVDTTLTHRAWPAQLRH